jgi:prefoldin subunit 4
MAPTLRVCNVPGCDKAGTKTCTGCKEVAYCSADCQRSDWKVHKKVCRRLHLAKSTPTEDTPVLWEDQARINKFAKLNMRHMELGDLIAESEKQLDNLKDGVDDIGMLMDDDACQLRVGNIFVSVSNEDAEERVEKLKETEEATLEALKEEHSGLRAQMDEIKVLLYKKFGDSINLEPDSGKHVA